MVKSLRIKSSDSVFVGDASDPLALDNVTSPLWKGLLPYPETLKTAAPVLETIDKGFVGFVVPIPILPLSKILNLSIIFLIIIYYFFS